MKPKRENFSIEDALKLAEFSCAANVRVIAMLRLALQDAKVVKVKRQLRKQK